jgi:hypothetical protein
MSPIGQDEKHLRAPDVVPYAPRTVRILESQCGLVNQSNAYRCARKTPAFRVRGWVGWLSRQRASGRFFLLFIAPEVGIGQHHTYVFL